MNNKNPKYDNDLVTLGYLKSTFQDGGENTTDLSKYIPKSYSSPPVPPYYVGAILYYNNSVYKCKKDRTQGSFDINDWELLSNGDGAFTDWVETTYVSDKSDLQQQIDGKIQSYYQATDPNTWTTDIEKASHVGDYWYNTTNDTQWRFCRYETNPVTYGWEQVDVPTTLKNLINSKMTIFTEKPTSYKANDMWIIEDYLPDADLPEGTIDNPIVRGDWVFATQDGDSYDKDDWEKRDTDIKKEDLENNYYTAGQVDTAVNRKLENYVSVSTFAPYESKISHFENDYYTKDEIHQKLTDGSVTKVRTISAIFDENGMRYDDGDADTHTIINAEGVRVKKNNSDDTALYAGYIPTDSQQYPLYKGQTVVISENLIVNNHIKIGSHSRFENYEPDSNTNGTGCFYIG